MSTLVTIEVPGWKTFVKINYEITKRSNQTVIIWKVIGTNHTFTIPFKTVTANHGGKYEEHFKVTLKCLRDDIIEWYKKGFPEKYMKYYFREFYNFIVF